MFKIIYFHKVIHFYKFNDLFKTTINLYNINLFFLKNQYNRNYAHCLQYLNSNKIYVFMPQKNVFTMPINYFTKKIEFCFYCFGLKKFKFTINFLLFLKFQNYFVLNINPKNPFIIKSCYYFNIKHFNIYIQNIYELKTMYKFISVKKKLSSFYV